MSKYCIIGTGKQGSAALYDLILFSNATSILLLDSNENSIKECLKRIDKKLVNNISIDSAVVDINDQGMLVNLLKPIDIMLSSVPYQFNLMLTKVAIESATSKKLSNRHINHQSQKPHRPSRKNLAHSHQPLWHLIHLPIFLYY